MSDASDDTLSLALSHQGRGNFDVTVTLVETPEELEGARAVRRRVFVEEQGVPFEEEYDDYDAVCTHAVAIAGGAVIGTGRMFDQGSGEARIGRMAVDAAYRHRGVGRLVLQTLEAEARRQGLLRSVLHAQTYVQDFYLHLGYAPEGPLFMEAGIEHVTMCKEL